MADAARESFTAGAARLAGLMGALFGWRPADFWSATPADVATLLAALRPEGEGGAMDRAGLAALEAQLRGADNER